MALGEAGGAPVEARGPVSKVFETEKKRFQMKIRIRQAGHIDESQGVEWPQYQPPKALRGAETNGREAGKGHPGQDKLPMPETCVGECPEPGVQVFNRSLA